jgi:hypothetical protein
MLDSQDAAVSSRVAFLLHQTTIGLFLRCFSAVMSVSPIATGAALQQGIRLDMASDEWLR